MEPSSAADLPRPVDSFSGVQHRDMDAGRWRVLAYGFNDNIADARCTC